MSGSTMSLQEFLGHSARGPKRNYLSGWKQNPPYSTLVWLHTMASLIAVWRHPFHELVAKEDKATRVIFKEVWGSNINCAEHESILSKQSFRDRETGARQHPPEKCPMCFMIEDVRDRVDAGQLDWRQPIFRFDATDPSKTQTLHAGGIYNAYGKKDLTGEQKLALAQASISPATAWNENLMAKLSYIFTVVEHMHPEKGIQVAMETSLLGDKVKGEIAKRMKSKGSEAGNPMLNPYAIEFSFNPDKNIQFDKKYDATIMEQVQLTAAIDKLIRQTEPPDLSGLMAPPNYKTLLARMQQHALVQLPFESYFAKVDMTERAAAPKPQTGTRVPDVGRPPPPPIGQQRVSQGVQPQQAYRPGGVHVEQPYVPPAAAPPPQEELVACDACQQAIPISATKCVHCGVQFEMDTPEPPPPARLPTRSEARAARGMAAPPAAAPAPAWQPPPAPQYQPPPAPAYQQPPAQPGFDDFAPDDGGEDEIPF